MSDDVLDMLDRLEQGQKQQAPSRPHYSLTKPQFKFPATSQPQNRDRYRSQGRGRQEDVYDVPEDDDPYGHGEMLDSFDEAMLERPVHDRQKQAERGKARLSFPPKANKYTGFGAKEGSTNSASQHGPSEHYEKPRMNLSQFAYTPDDASSEVQLGTSSPAFMASQRRAESHHVAAPRPPSWKSEYQPQEPTQRHGPMQQEQPTKRRQSAQQQDDLYVNPNPKATQRPAPSRLNLPHAPPVIQGISLVPVTALPDRMRAVFPFPTFNAVQSKCFDQVYRSEDNFVLASPTGSGKTAILELAICRAFANNAAGQYKIVYQAPIKALCSERQQDWQKKFSPLGLNTVELTGDNDNTNTRHVQEADIIVTTPEKWDSITRKWKDHEKLMRLVKLFLIDEVHILKEDRGAVLEAVVSRMKTTGTDVRFVALSATVPNLGDVATWIGKNPAEPYVPANHEKFGEEFRPVKLQKHVCGFPGSYNDFQFESVLDTKLPEVVAKYSHRKPIMVFCATRAATSRTAKLLANWWSSNPPQRRFWREPSKPLNIQNPELRNYISCGVAFHHAALDSHDRLAVEKGFLAGEVNVICCTSTLAVGVNLPCHMVIIKNTVTWKDLGLQEYSDLEVMQMMGRAGRPQFDDSAVAVILTRQAKVRRYETMVTGQELLESKLHVGLIEHLNAEVGLGTIRDLSSARKWLSRTFLYVRIKQNPAYYKLEGARSGQDIDEQLDDICLRDLGLLQENSLVKGDQSFKCTDFGEAMARYYVKFGTMKMIVGLQPKAQISEILSALSQAAEFNDIRFRSGEKPLYKTLNSSPSIRFPIPVTLNHPAHKVSLIIQSVLGGAEVIWDKDTQKHRTQYTHDIAAVFKHAHRLIRCIADCQISLRDSVAVLHALLIQRSLSAQAWDDGPLHMRQIPDIGIVSVRRLVNAGIRTIEEMEFTESQRLEMIIKRNPPFGLKLLEKIRAFPKLRVSVQVVPNSTRRTDDGVKIQLKVEIGLLNEKPVHMWKKNGFYVCLMVETSDGRMIHFARTSAQNIVNGQDVFTPALLTSADQSVNCYLMCDEIAGTMRDATVKPKIAPSMFPTQKPNSPSPKPVPPRIERPASNMSKRRADTGTNVRRPSGGSDEFDDGLDDDDFVRASIGDLDFDHIDNYANPTNELTRNNTAQNTKTKDPRKARGRTKSLEDNDNEPRQLENGNWACNHRCKDKTACKHICCREGLDRPPKRPVKKAAIENHPASQISTQKEPEKKGGKTQTKLLLTASKRKSSADFEVLDLTQQEKKRKSELVKSGPRDYRNLHQLHKNVQKKDPPASISSITHKKPAYCYSSGGEHSLSFLDNSSKEKRRGTGTSSDYGDLQIDELSTYAPEFGKGREKDLRYQSHAKHTLDKGDGPVDDHVSDRYSDIFGDEDSVLEEAMVGLADSQDIQAAHKDNKDDEATESFDMDIDYDAGFFDEDLEAGVSALESSASDPLQTSFGTSIPSTPGLFVTPDQEHDKYRDLGDTISGTKRLDFGGFQPAKSTLTGSALEELKQTKGEVAPFANLKSKEPGRLFEVEDSVGVEDAVMGSSSPVQLNAYEEEKEKDAVPAGFQGLEPWLFEEFGDIVELVDE